MNKVVHFEIPADDVARAKEFYGSIFDWELQDMDMGARPTRSCGPCPWTTNSCRRSAARSTAA
jgi:hypothetical protein